MLFIKDYLANYLEKAAPIIMDDVQIVNDCPHLLFLPEIFSEFLEMFKNEQLLPVGFEDEMAALNEVIDQLREEEQEAADEELEEEQDYNDQKEDNEYDYL
jgi:phosphoglycerate-specific signal transduction histidine kinase